MMIYNNLFFYIATLKELNHTLHRFTNYHYLRLYMSNPSAATITAHYPWAIGLLHGDVNLSELERLDKPCATVGLGRELMIIRILSLSEITSYYI